MPMHTYSCDNCGNSEYRNIYQEKDFTWAELCFVRGPTQAQLDKMDFDKGDDPRDFEVWKVVNYGDDLPEKVKCNKCKKKKAKFTPPDVPKIKNGRNSYAAMRERRRFATEGMDKKQAEQFYKEAVQASKERMETGGQHYKKIVPHYETLRKEGKVRKLNDQERADKIELLKRANQQITKDGKIGRPNRKR